MEIGRFPLPRVCLYCTGFFAVSTVLKEVLVNDKKGVAEQLEDKLPAPPKR